MALHLTLTDASFFWKLEMGDFQNFCDLTPQKTNDTNVFRLIEKRFDRMVWIIVSMVCWSEMPEKLIEYWVNVEEELLKMGNLHGLMMVNGALCHYLVEGLKKAWGALGSEQSRIHQKVMAMFQPKGNYKEYRSWYKERAGKILDHVCFGKEEGEDEKNMFFSLAMPLLQRDVILAK
jgi:hypothetical protein